MLGDGRIGVCRSLIAEGFATIIVNNMIVEALWAYEECGLRTLRGIVVKTCYSMIYWVFQLCLPRSDTLKIHTLRMVEAWHQLHVAVGIRDSHEGLVGNPHVRMVVALARAGGNRGRTCWFQRNLLCAAIFFIIVSFQDTFFQTGRSHVSSQVSAIRLPTVVIYELQLYVIWVKTALVLIGYLSAYFRQRFTSTR